MLDDLFLVLVYSEDILFNICNFLTYNYYFFMLIFLQKRFQIVYAWIINLNYKGE